MHVLDWLLWFFLYSFVGWAWETALFTVQERRFVNRGFLNGPFCPIYGFGALLLLLLLENNVSNIFALFFIAVFLTTSLEYLTAVLLENLFHAKWWDYSMFPLNYKGRISVISSAVFGIFAVLQIRFIHPFVRSLTGRIPENLKSIILLLVIIYLFIDFTLTIRHVFIMNGRLSEIQGALNDFFGKYYRRAGELRDSIRVSFEESEFYSERIKTLFSLGRLQNRRIIRAFPKLRSFQYDDALKKMKARVLRKKNAGDNQNEQDK
ncbi:MAG: putative ABC transporter permease [Clostridiales bacterium]|nr:putative ABC transporter permease [Clostridiales bacterium]